MDSDIEMTEFLPAGRNDRSVFSRLPHYDLLAFLAIAQNMNDVHFLEFMPSFDDDLLTRGANTLLHATKLSKKEGIIYKRIDPMTLLSEKDGYKTVISELVVHEHAVIRTHPNIQQIYGIAWDVHVENNRVLPVFAFEKSQHGDLEAFLARNNDRLSFMQRLKFCLDIGLAIETLHSLNVVLGDIKPKNVLIFERENGEYLAKITDFGCSCFGLDEQDIVNLSRTRGWEAPEYRRGTFTVAQAKKYDVYVYGKLCFWVLFGHEADIGELNISSLGGPTRCRLEDTMILLQRSGRIQDEFKDFDSASTKLGIFFQSSLVEDTEGREGSFQKVLDSLYFAEAEFRRRWDLHPHP